MGRSFTVSLSIVLLITIISVSYTHLDVYKRQQQAGRRDEHIDVSILLLHFLESGVTVDAVFSGLFQQCGNSFFYFFQLRCAGVVHHHKRGRSESEQCPLVDLRCV